MVDRCSFCNKEHNKLLNSITDKAGKIAEEFTDKAFDTIWETGNAKIFTFPMNKKTLAKFMFLTGATQILTTHLVNELEKSCISKN